MLNLKISTLEKYISRYPWFSAGYQEVYKKICQIEGDDGEAYLSKAASHVWSRANLYRIQKACKEAAKLRESESAAKQVSETVAEQVKVADHVAVAEQVTVAEQVAVDEQVKVAEQVAVDEQVTVAEQVAVDDQVKVAEQIKVADQVKVAEEEKQTESAAKQVSETVADQVKVAAPDDDILDLDDDDEILLDEISDMVPDQMPKFVLAGGDYFSKRDFEQIELDRSQPLDNFIAEKPTLIRAAMSKRSINPQPTVEPEEGENFEDASFYTETLASIYIEQGFYKRALDIYAKLILLYPEKSAYFATLVKDIKNKI